MCDFKILLILLSFMHNFFKVFLAAFLLVPLCIQMALIMLSYWEKWKKMLHFYSETLSFECWEIEIFNWKLLKRWIGYWKWKNPTPKKYFLGVMKLMIFCSSCGVSFVSLHWNPSLSAVSLFHSTNCAI